MTESREFAIISSLTQPDASVDAAIQQLLNLTVAAAAATKVNDFTDWPRKQDWDTPLSIHIENVWWALIEDVVGNTAPSQQAVLVEFIRVLQRQKVTDPTTGHQLLFEIVENEMEPMWNGLPLLGIHVLDEWRFDSTSSNPDPEEETRYYNKVAFLAQLINMPENDVPSPDVSPGPFDFSGYPLRCFRLAFEEADEPGALSIPLLRASSLWMTYCAERLWKNVQIERSFVHKASNTNQGAAGERYWKRYEQRRYWKGFNAERWGIWVHGLELGMEVEDEGVRQLVASALKAVERAEDQSWRITEDEKFA